MKIKRYTKFETPLCPIILVGDEFGISNLHLVSGVGRKFEISPDWILDDDFFIDSKNQIKAYFSGEIRKFEVPLNLSGTPFQLKVWEALRTIPFGETRSYKQIAEQIGQPNAARAVGSANNKNPIPLIVPCHRVIGAGGNLIGFAHGLGIKEKLLDFEKNNPAESNLRGL